MILVFGATGTAGDGILKAAMTDPDVGELHVVTRRSSPRIDAAMASGRVRMTTHEDFLRYDELSAILEAATDVFWALGTSARNVSKEDYETIHVDFPMRMAEAWLRAGSGRECSFHLVSGNGASPRSRFHWAREKARAERELGELAGETRMRVVSYRPPYIAPAVERATALQNLAHRVLEPRHWSMRSTAIGQAMLEVRARGEHANGAILERGDLAELAEAYVGRLGEPTRLREPSD